MTPLVCTLLGLVIANKTFSEVSKRGWRTEGVGARKSFIRQRFRPLFCAPFSCAPLGEGGHIPGELFWLFLGVCLSPIPSANPFPKDPAVLKIVRRANSLRGEKFATAIAKRYGECLRSACFCRERRQENGTESEKLRR